MNCLTNPSPTDLKQIRAIYESSFPPAERKPFEAIQQRLLSGEYICFVARANEAIVAFALLLPLPSANATFLEYVAVDTAYQSKGLGGELLHFIIDELATRLIWEVEPPVNDEPNNIRNRRLRFYERLGGQIIELSKVYQMPNFESGEGGVPLLLMQFPLEVQPNRSEVGALVEGIYRVAYPGWVDLRDEILLGLVT